MSDDNLPFSKTAIECPQSGRTHIPAYMVLGTSEAKSVDFLICFQIPAPDPDTDLRCCCCEKEILQGNPMFQHPQAAPKFKGANLYCHRECYHDDRATKKAKFPSSCAVCAEKIPIGEGITKNADGKWVHDPPCKFAIRVNRKLTAEEHDRMALLSVITPSDRQLSFLHDHTDGPNAKLAKTSHSSREQTGMGYAMASSPASDALLRHLENNADYLHKITGTGSTSGDLEESQGTTIAGDESQETGDKL
ncbi:hypothetical protein B484DRAFT_436134 [Ochromonadaceae sp. CCMP2298]|nr:hypothetical protein B484DRAFT_436134 [Ochromonadaceae sp. CCMP2298]